MARAMPGSPMMPYTGSAPNLMPRGPMPQPVRTPGMPQPAGMVSGAMSPAGMSPRPMGMAPGAMSPGAMSPRMMPAGAASPGTMAPRQIGLPPQPEPRQAWAAGQTTTAQQGMAPPQQSTQGLTRQQSQPAAVTIGTLTKSRSQEALVQQGRQQSQPAAVTIGTLTKSRSQEALVQQGTSRMASQPAIVQETSPEAPLTARAAPIARGEPQQSMPLTARAVMQSTPQIVSAQGISEGAGTVVAAEPVATATPRRSVSGKLVVADSGPVRRSVSGKLLVVESAPATTVATVTRPSMTASASVPALKAGEIAAVPVQTRSPRGVSFAVPAEPEPKPKKPLTRLEQLSQPRKRKTAKIRHIDEVTPGSVVFQKAMHENLAGAMRRASVNFNRKDKHVIQKPIASRMSVIKFGDNPNRATIVQGNTTDHHCFF